MRRKEYSKPQVTIDLEEYQELLKIKSISRFHSIHKDLYVRFIESPDKLTLGVNVGDGFRQDASLGLLTFKRPEDLKDMLAKWDISFIRKRDGNRIK